MAGDRPDALKRVVKAIQTCRRQVAGLQDDTAWREFLARVTKGGTSLRAMGGRDLGRVLDALHASGAPRPAGGARRSRYVDDQQTRMMRGLWIEAHETGKVADPSEEALNAFVRRQTRQDMGALDARAARAVIEALKAMLKRPSPATRRAA